MRTYQIACQEFTANGVEFVATDPSPLTDDKAEAHRRHLIRRNRARNLVVSDDGLVLEFDTYVAGNWDHIRDLEERADLQGLRTRVTFTD
jgi:hypothetical protein